MAIVQVQKTTATGINGVTGTFSSTPTVGNLMIAVHFTRAVTSTGPSGWAQDVLINNATESDQLAIYSRVVQSGDGTSYAFGDVSDNHALVLFEYSGLATSSVFDKGASTGRTTAASSLSSGTTAATTVADELVIVGIGLRLPGTTAATAPSWSNSFTQEADAQNAASVNAQIFAGSKIVSATGTQESTCSWSTTTNTVMGIIATYKTTVAGVTVKNLAALGVG